MGKKTVLLIGARGFMGSKVADAVIAKQKYNVKAMVRRGGGSATDAMQEKGVVIVEGDMMKPDTLLKACTGVDVVINTANGYSTGHPEIDIEGAQNVVDACKEAGVKRYIYCR